MLVRKAVTSDAEAISNIAKATFPLACPANTPAEELERYTSDHLTVSCFQAALATSSQEIQVVEKAGEVVGFSLIDYKPDRLNIAQADGIPELKRCYVASKQHGTGAAQRLLTDTLADISGCIRLTVNDQNARAIGFYERNGFVQVGETSFQCGEDVHRDLVMVRGLKPGADSTLN